MSATTKNMAVALLAALSSRALASKTGDEHPMEKVIALLKDLSAKAEAEGREEAVAFDKYSHWCAVSTKTLNAAIAEEKETIASLTEQIAGEKQTIKELGEQIAKLEKEIEASNQAGEKAKELRDEGAELYATASSDHQTTIDAIKEAIKGLEESEKASSFAQVVAKVPKLKKVLLMAEAMLPASAPAAQRSALAGLLQESPERPEQLAEGDEAAHVLNYDFKSGNIIELLKALQTKFEDELVSMNTGETNALNSYDLEKQARDAAIAAAEKSKGEKETTKGSVEEDLAIHEEALSDTENELKADTDTLTETTNGCTTKNEEWETRSKTRANELEAISVAIGILAKVTGVRTEAPSNPVPPPAPTEAAASFLQIADPRQKALTLIKSKAKAMHSKTLARMAQELVAHMDDPFSEVNNMIEKMIFRLQQEQTDEDNHKHWCDQEISQTNTSRTQKEEKISELDTKVEGLETSIQKLTMDIEDADAMVAKIVSFMAEATEIRKVGKDENAKALKDAQDAQTAIANANAVITAHYKESGMVATEAWEFVQRGVELPENPSTWEAGYTGVADPKDQPGGIITVLETVASDFAQMEAETKAQEAEDQKEFEETMKESEIEKAQRAKESEVKNAERGRQVNKLESTKKQRKHTSDELEAVNQYYKDLGPACYEGDSTYEDRKAARDAEIGALHEAEEILAKAFEETPEEEATMMVAKKGGKKFLAPVHKKH